MKLNNLFPLFIYNFLLARHSEVGDVYKDAKSYGGKNNQSACNYTFLEHPKLCQQIHWNHAFKEYSAVPKTKG